MKNYSNNSSFRGGRSERGGDRGDRQMHHARCADCGRDCEVPFRPTGDKPVYCSNCFKRDESPRDDRGGRPSYDRGGRSERGGEYKGRDDRGRSERGKPGMHKAICDDCGKNCEVPFRPTGDKPIYCSDCFGGGSGSNKSYSPAPKKVDQSAKKHDEMNAKLEKIIYLLEKMVSGKSKSEGKTVEKAVEKAEPKKEKNAEKVVAAKKVAEKKEVKKAPVKKAEVKKAAPKKATVKKDTAKKPAAKKVMKKATAKKK